MGTTVTIHVERVLPERIDLTGGEVDAVLEAAYLVNASEGRLTDDASDALRAVASGLRSTALPDADFAALVSGFGAPCDAATRDARIAALRGRLGRSPARELAYKVALALSLCDLDAYDDDTCRDGDFAGAFGIDDVRADALASEVYEALDSELDRDSEHPRVATSPPPRDPFV